ncbi:MAG TPA: amidase family protein [Rhizomicrobium sp.]|jgi:amidase|nr:amidase family protein [Rhizomicrobium sp.]
MAFAEYADYDGLGLAHLVRKGAVTPLELVEEAIARIEKHNGVLNAVVYKAYDEARAAAKGKLPEGPFKGVPFLIKDISMEVAGWPMTNGSALLEGYVSKDDAELTKRYRAAGMVLAGKTNTPEFGIPGTTEGRFLGNCHNPWNPDHSTGGSSGGAAACVAAGIVPMAHASDGLGSIRIPAAQCGLFGMKPTQFRNPGGPDDRGRAHGLIVDHIVSRSVRDSAAMLDWTGYPEDDAPYAPAPKSRPYTDEIATPPGKLRIAYCAETVQATPLHPDVQAMFEKTVTLCGELGHTMIELPSLGVHLRKLYKAQGYVSGAMAVSGYEEWAEKMGRPIDESTLEFLALVGYRGAKEIPAKDVAWGLQQIRLIGRDILRLYRNFDVLLQPIQITPPPPLGFLDPMNVRAREFNQRQGRTFGLTPLANLTGQPAMSVPMGLSADKLPLAAMFSGRYGDEATLFRLAAQLEQTHPWIDRKPPIWD